MRFGLDMDTSVAGFITTTRFLGNWQTHMLLLLLVPYQPPNIDHLPVFGLFAVCLLISRPTTQPRAASSCPPVAPLAQITPNYIDEIDKITPGFGSKAPLAFIKCVSAAGQVCDRP